MERRKIFFAEKSWVSTGDLIKIPRGVKHTIIADEPLKIINVKKFCDARRNFCAEKANKIRFNEKIGDDAENLFAVEAMFQTEEIIFTSTVFYAAR